MIEMMINMITRIIIILMIFINIKLIIIKLIMIIIITKRQRNIFEVLAFYFRYTLVYSRDIVNNT